MIYLFIIAIVVQKALVKIVREKIMIFVRFRISVQWAISSRSDGHLFLVIDYYFWFEI